MTQLWEIIGAAPSEPGNPRVFARCACGTERVVLKASITAGRSRSCGCTSGKGIPESVRFESKISVDEATGCWNWIARLTRGYGSFSRGRRHVYAHRYAWERANGPIPDGLHLDHLCRNTRCCNPDHLEPVTPRVNVLRGESPSAVVVRTNHCKRGHEFTPDNTYLRPDGGGRQCRTCNHLRARKRWANRVHVSTQGSWLDAEAS